MMTELSRFVVDVAQHPLERFLIQVCIVSILFIAARVFEFIYWVLDLDYNLYIEIQKQINLSLMEQFEEKSISFATPVRVIQLNARLTTI